MGVLYTQEDSITKWTKYFIEKRKADQNERVDYHIKDIAEGDERETDKEAVRYFYIAKFMGHLLKYWHRQLSPLK